MQFVDKKAMDSFQDSQRSLVASLICLQQKFKLVNQFQLLKSDNTSTKQPLCPNQQAFKYQHNNLQI
uniref:Uncharacterized protein n=1 Tax=Rhizophora mucronata TaxID=61149 RepID=A0A2P2M2H5_RHIMU